MSNFLNKKTNGLFSLSLPGILFKERDIVGPSPLITTTLHSEGEDNALLWYSYQLIFLFSLNDSFSSSHFHNWSPFLLPESNLCYIFALNHELHQGSHSNACMEQGASPDEWEIFVHAYSKRRVGFMAKRSSNTSVPFAICHMKMLSNRPIPLDLLRKAHFLYMILIKWLPIYMSKYV